MATQSEHIIVTTVTDSYEEAERLASVIMEKKLAACVQVIGPIMSMFRWEGELKKEKEWMVQAKTIGQWYEMIEGAIKENHSYELPEIIGVPIQEGFVDYLEWIRSEMNS